MPHEQAWIDRCHYLERRCLDKSRELETVKAAVSRAKTAVYLAAIIALLATGAATLWTAHSIAGMRSDLRATQDRATATLDAARGDLAITLAGVLNESAAWRMTADKRIGSLERRTDAQLTALRETVAGTMRKADGVLDGLAKIPAGLSPVLTEAQRTVAAARPVLESSDRAVRLLTPQALGMVAALKVTSGETATTMREFRRATPEFIRIGQEFGRASTATAVNVERITRPARWWETLLRVGGPAAGGAIFGVLK